MKNYDLAFSLGYACGCSQALRDAGLQFASFPMDWLCSPNVMRSAEVVASGFDRWLEKDDLELVDVRHGSGFGTRVYRNVRTGFGFSHEFGAYAPFAETYPTVLATVNRRIQRLKGLIATSRHILGVYLEMPFRPCLSEVELQAARNVITKAFPNASFDLLYVYEDPSCSKPKVMIDRQGIRAVALDYRLFDHGEVTHFVRTAALRDFLHQEYVVKDYRTKAERLRREGLPPDDGMRRWGASPGWHRNLNRWAFRLYRHLERYLQSRGIVEREGPLWFVDREGALR